MGQNPAAVLALRAGRITALAVTVGALADVGFEIRIVGLRIVAHEAAVDAVRRGTADSVHRQDFLSQTIKTCRHITADSNDYNQDHHDC